MARATKLKVYRTPIGFHDAYVAAPSQKAALEAWGSDHNLFARGAAELVSDPALSAEPLAQPGKVIKRLRGTADEQLAALGPTRRAASKPAPKTAAASGRRKARPRPDRAPLDRAETAFADAERRHAREHQAIVDEEKRLAEQRRALEREQEKELAELKHALNRTRTVYQRAVDAWHADS